MFALRSIKGWLIKAAGGALLVTLLAGIALTPAYAAGSTDPVKPPDPAVQRLANIFQREQKWLGLQAEALADAKTIATNAQDFINKLKGEGKDASGLEKALTAFQNDIANAQAAHDAAANLLSKHTGFDNNGQMTDKAQAVSALRDAYQSLQSAHKLLVSAVTNLRQAIHDLQNAHS